MTYPLRNRKFNSGRCLAVIALGCSGLISACSSDGTTTILENGQTLSVDLPARLTSATGEGLTFEEVNLRPVVTLSNGETVGTTWVGNSRWSGTINVETDAVYRVTVTWVERFADQDLPLTRRTLDIAVGADGSAVEVEGSRTEYSEQGQGLDADGDGVSNLDERLADQNPLPDEMIDVPGVENPAIENPGTENPATENPGTENPETESPGTDAEFPASILTITAGSESEPQPFRVGLPELLERTLREGVLIISDLRPLVSVSRGNSVTPVPMQEADNNSWTGSFDADSTGVYKVNVTWVEDYLGQALNLTSRSFDVAIGADGSIVPSGETGWSIDFDFDRDGPSNLQERQDGTNPRRDESERAVPTTMIDTGNINDNSETSIISDSLPASSDVIVPRISVTDAPTIDGMNVTTDSQNQLTGEWAQAVQGDTSGAPLIIENLLINNDAESVGKGPYRRWAAMHDGRYLYVVVLVDDNGQRYRDSGTVLFDDDSLELYLDADYSHSTTVDKNYFHRQFPLRAPGGNGNAASKIGVTSGDLRGPESSTAPLQIDFATGPGRGPDGLRRANFEQDVYELRISLEAAGISTDSPFGFELHINDDDDGQTRDSRWGWRQSATSNNDIDDGLLARPIMGTLMLE